MSDKWDVLGKEVAVGFHNSYFGSLVLACDGSCALVKRLAPRIASVLRSTADAARKEERDNCIKDAKMYVLDDDEDFPSRYANDPMAIRQNQIARAIVRMIEQRWERKENNDKGM